MRTLNRLLLPRQGQATRIWQIDAEHISCGARLG